MVNPLNMTLFLIMSWKDYTILVFDVIRQSQYIGLSYEEGFKVYISFDQIYSFVLSFLLGHFINENRIYIYIILLY